MSQATFRMRLGCLHMHHSNIAYIDAIVPGERVETLHFVDPGLMHRLSAAPPIDPDDARSQVRRQLGWMAECELGAMLITCTNYIAMLPDEPLDLAVPVVMIDEPFFAWLLAQPAPRLLIFTNPATVAGTMRRLRAFAVAHGQNAAVDVEIIPGTFELLMAGKTDDYAAAVAGRLRELARTGGHQTLAVGQLSLAAAARQIAAETDTPIGSPLGPLRDELARVLDTPASR